MNLYKIKNSAGEVNFINLDHIDFILISKLPNTTAHELYIKFVRGDTKITVGERTAHDLEEYLEAWQ